MSIDLGLRDNAGWMRRPLGVLCAVEQCSGHTRGQHVASGVGPSKQDSSCGYVHEGTPKRPWKRELKHALHFGTSKEKNSCIVSW